MKVTQVHHKKLKDHLQKLKQLLRKYKLKDVTNSEMLNKLLRIQ